MTELLEVRRGGHVTKETPFTQTWEVTWHQRWVRVGSKYYPIGHEPAAEEAARRVPADALSRDRLLEVGR